MDKNAQLVNVLLLMSPRIVIKLQKQLRYPQENNRTILKQREISALMVTDKTLRDGGTSYGAKKSNSVLILLGYKELLVPAAVFLHQVQADILSNDMH